MSNMKDILRDVGYFTVGAAAVLVEAGSKAARCLVHKGEQTLRDNQETVDDLKRKAKDLGEKAKELGEKAKAAMEKSAKPENAPVDASQLTPEARAELRRQLDEMDTVCEPEEPVVPDVCEPEEPVVPDVIYRAGEAVSEEPQDTPETTANG